MTRRLALVALLLVFGARGACAQPIDGPLIYPATVDRLVDCDTFAATVTLLDVPRVLTVPISVRLRVADLRCPERNTEQGKRVNVAAAQLLTTTSFRIRVQFTGAVTFNRFVARVWMPDGRTYEDALRAMVAWTDPGR